MGQLPDHVLITGGTGFIGTALSKKFLESGVRISVVTRDRSNALRHFNGQVSAFESLSEINVKDAPDVIINLAGKNLGSERWNRKVKEEIITSRVKTTQEVVSYIARADPKPGLLINGSAVGYYGARGDEELTEDSPAGDEYQSELCKRWEETAMRAADYGVRVCISRTGVVMGRGGGVLSGLLPMFRKGMGAVVGNGNQWISWIHMDDLARIFLDFIQDDQLYGAFNNTSPNPVTNRQFVKTIGQIVEKPVFLRIPGWLMRLQAGEMAHLYVTGQKVIPTRHLHRGFQYRYADINNALKEAIAL